MVWNLIQIRCFWNQILILSFTLISFLFNLRVVKRTCYWFFFYLNNFLDWKKVFIKNRKFFLCYFILNEYFKNSLYFFGKYTYLFVYIVLVLCILYIILYLLDINIHTWTFTHSKYINIIWICTRKKKLWSYGREA